MGPGREQFTASPEIPLFNSRVSSGVNDASAEMSFPDGTRSLARNPGVNAAVSSRAHEIHSAAIAQCSPISDSWLSVMSEP